jgi:B12-binding domain/radical SAM domain protein
MLKTPFKHFKTGVLVAKLHVLIYYNRHTRYSLNPLIAAIDRALKNVLVTLTSSLEELRRKVLDANLRGDKCVAMFSLLTTMLTSEVFLSDLVETVNLLKKYKCTTIVGGPHATGDPVGSLKSLGFDYAFIGEGEESLVEFLTALQTRDDVKKVKGVSYLENEKFVFSGRRRPVNLDDYDPFPYWRGLFGPIEITRGCPYGCFYCQVSYMHGFEYRHRSVEKVTYYVEVFLKSRGRDVRFITPDGLSYGLKTRLGIPSVDLLEHLLEAVGSVCGRYGGRIFYGTFPSELRPEHVTDEALRVLRKYVSNRRVIIGAQTGSERLLKLLRRGHSVENVKNAVEIALKYGFIPDVDIIIGFPGETVEDLKSTLDLASWITNRGGRIHVHYFMPLPGTPLSYQKPTVIPLEVKRVIARIIGSQRGYGDWINQEKIAWKIVELREKGVISPRAPST